LSNNYILNWTFHELNSYFLNCKYISQIKFSFYIYKLLMLILKVFFFLVNNQSNTLKKTFKVKQKLQVINKDGPKTRLQATFLYFPDFHNSF